MPVNSEARIQSAVVAWARANQNAMPELALLHASLNGAQLAGGARQWGFLVAQGALAGIPDLCLPVPRGGFAALWIELKTQSGRVSPAQVRIQALLEQAGNKVAVCRSAEQTVEEIQNYLAGKAGKGSQE